MLPQRTATRTLFTRRFRASREAGSCAGGIEGSRRNSDHIRALKPLEIGLMFWAKEDARETLREVKGFGVAAGQLGFPGELDLRGKAEAWQAALRDEDFTVVTAVCSYVGEDYADIPTVQRTVGLVPADTRAQRIERTKQVANVAAKLGISSVACHIGFVPHD